MPNMPVGMIALIIAAVLIYFGLAERVLDRMHLTDRSAFAFIALIIVGSYIDINLMREPAVSINAGGALVPIVLAGYLYTKAGTTKERTRAVLAPIVTGVAIYILGRVMPGEPEVMLMEPMYVFAIVAGLIAYLMGRSRRAAFIAGTIGIIISDLLHWAEIVFRGIPGTVAIGGAGAFDAVIIAGLLAVFLAEVIGETRERLQGGPTPLSERNPEVQGMNFTPHANPVKPEEPDQPEGVEPSDEDYE